MRYLLSMIGDETDWQSLKPDEAQAMIDQVESFNNELKKAGAWVYAEGLQDRASAKTVRFGQGGTTTVSDGPFTDARMQPVGFWVIEAATIDEAVGWTKKAGFGKGATIEVRPLAAE